MNTELDSARDARTEGRSQWATCELWEWLRRNPTNTGIREAVEGLSLMQDIAEEQEAERTRESRQPVEAGQAM